MNYNETLSSSVLFTFTHELDFLLDMLSNGIILMTVHIKELHANFTMKENGGTYL